MEKQSPHYDLAEIKVIVGRRGADAFTQTALRGIDDMALTYAEGIMVVLSMQRSMLFKSMTTPPVPTRKPPISRSRFMRAQQ